MREEIVIASRAVILALIIWWTRRDGGKVTNGQSNRGEETRERGGEHLGAAKCHPEPTEPEGETRYRLGRLCPIPGDPLPAESPPAPGAPAPNGSGCRTARAPPAARESRRGGGNLPASPGRGTRCGPAGADGGGTAGRSRGRTGSGRDHRGVRRGERREGARITHLRRRRRARWE